jgi:hypothetical protein
MLRRTAPARCAQCDARLGCWPVTLLPICSPECQLVWDGLVHSRIDDLLLEVG